MLAHASIDENGTTVGATPGDQTGKEVVIRSWYSKPWNYVIRCTDATMRERIAKAMENAANNPCVGYSQPHRNDLLKSCRSFGYNPANATTPCDCDCSSLVSIACMYASIPENQLYVSGNCCTTSNIRSKLMATGKFITLTDSKYLSGDQYLYRGDILLREPGHVAVNITDGKFVAEDSKPTSTSDVKMVDVSKYNVITDYKLLASQIKRIIIRCGYRSSSSGVITEDSSFKKHIENCLANGMTVGVYFYDQSINETEAIEQANWVMNIIKPYNVALPIYIDSEAVRNHDGRADNISKDQRTKNVVAFCNRIQQLGHAAGVYASSSWFKSMLNFDSIKQFSIWCARYSTTPPDIPRYDIWQYGSEYYSWATNIIDTNIVYNLKENVKPSTENKPSIPNKPTQTQQSSGLTPEKSILLMGKVVINGGTLNVRSQPNTNAPIVTQLQKDTYIQLRGDLGTWYRMDLGYVSKQYVKEAHGVATANLNLRSTPDSSNDNNIILTMPKDTEVIICTANLDWYHVLLSNGKTGWVKGTYIKLK